MLQLQGPEEFPSGLFLTYCQMMIYCQRRIFFGTGGLRGIDREESGLIISGQMSGYPTFDPIYPLVTTNGSTYAPM